jgi:hypothetical protein
MRTFDGFHVDPNDLDPATGAWRTNKALGVYCWEGFVTDDHGIRRFIGSYDTMTELLKSNVKLCFLDDFEITGEELGD